MPAPVASRRRFTSAAVKAGMSLPLLWWWWCGHTAPRSPGGQDGPVPLTRDVRGVRRTGGQAPSRGSPRACEGCGGRGPSSAVLGALGAGGVVAGGRHALDGRDLGGGDGRRLGRGLRQLGRRGSGVRGRRGGVGATGEEL